MGCGVQLPERPGFEALPAAGGSRRTGLGQWMAQLMTDGPAPDRGGVYDQVQAAEHFRSGQAVRGRRFGGEQFAQQRLNARRPIWSMIPTRCTGLPTINLAAGCRTQIVGIEFIEAGASKAKLFGGGGSGDTARPQGRENLTYQRSAKTMGKLPIMFFIGRRMSQCRQFTNQDGASPAGLPSAFATLWPPPGPPGWRCSPLLAHLFGFDRTLFAFACRATGKIPTAAPGRAGEMTKHARRFVPDAPARLL